MESRVWRRQGSVDEEIKVIEDPIWDFKPDIHLSMSHPVPMVFWRNFKKYSDPETFICLPVLISEGKKTLKLYLWIENLLLVDTDNTFEWLLCCLVLLVTMVSPSQPAHLFTKHHCSQQCESSAPEKQPHFREILKDRKLLEFGRQFSSCTNKVRKGKCAAKIYSFHYCQLCWAIICKKLWINAEGKSVGGNSRLRCCRVFCMTPPSSNSAFAESSQNPIYQVFGINPTWFGGQHKLHFG